MPDETTPDNGPSETARDTASVTSKSDSGAAANRATENIAAHRAGVTPEMYAKNQGEYDFRALAIAVSGWIFPGLGHALLKMWGRAATIFLAVGFLVYLGAGMRGNLFAAGGDDAFARLGYAADLGAWFGAGWSRRLSRRGRLRHAISRCRGRLELIGGAARLRSSAQAQSVTSMVPLQLSHFQSLLLFALVISLAFGTLGRRQPIERLKYAAWSFAMFVLVAVVLGWLMYPVSR